MLSLIAFLLASQASLVLAGYRQVRFHPMHFQYRKCLDVKDGVFFNGQAVQIWDCNGSAAQEWFIWDGDHFNHGTISIRAPGQNKAYCLDGSDRSELRIRIPWIPLKSQAWKKLVCPTAIESSDLKTRKWNT